jgi:hypothetical protein
MYDAECTGAINYLNLAREILQNNGLVGSTSGAADQATIEGL